MTSLFYIFIKKLNECLSASIQDSEIPQKSNFPTKAEPFDREWYHVPQPRIDPRNIPVKQL